MERLLSIRNMSKCFGQKKVLNDINLEVYEKEILVIMGPSGCGKSTLLNIIGKLDPVFSGDIHYEPILFDGVRVPFPFVFQESESLLPWKNVYDNLKLVSDGVNERDIEAVLRTVDLWEHRNKRPSELSGGMKQRVGIARALMCHSKILFMDEPFSSLDVELRLKMQNLVVNLKVNQGLSIVFVTHDIDEASRIGDRIVQMENGCIK